MTAGTGGRKAVRKYAEREGSVSVLLHIQNAGPNFTHRHQVVEREGAASCGNAALVDDLVFETLRGRVAVERPRKQDDVTMYFGKDFVQATRHIVFDRGELCRPRLEVSSLRQEAEAKVIEREALPPQTRWVERLVLTMTLRFRG